EDGIRDYKVTGVQTCALPISILLHAFFQRIEIPCDEKWKVCCAMSKVSWCLTLLMRMGCPWINGRSSIARGVGARISCGRRGAEIGRASCREREKRRGVAGRV